VKDFCESKELFNASIHWCFIRIDFIIVLFIIIAIMIIITLIIIILSKKEGQELAESKSTMAYKCYMFHVDILSGTKCILCDTQLDIS